MEEQDEIIALSDSDEEEEEEEEFKKFGSRSKKRKIGSDSEDEYVPPSVEKAKKKAKLTEKSSAAKRPRKKETVPKEKKPKAERKKPIKKVKADDVKDGISNQNSIEVPEDSTQSTSGLQKHSFDTINIKEGMEWREVDMVAELQQIEAYIAFNVMKLLDEDNTIPFIARYRKELTNNMSPEKLREVKASYDMVKSVKQKASTMMKSIAKIEKLTPLLEKSIRCARSIAELDLIYSPYKPGSKHTLAERARQLGLEDAATAILVGTKYVYLEQLLNPGKKGLEKISDIELGIQHIIADIISKDKDILDFVRKLKEDANFHLETSKARATSAKESNASKQKVKSEPKKEVDHKGHHGKVDNESKFEKYFKFSVPVKYIRPHQVLAVNRGKNLKFLTVKINVPDWIQYKLKDFCHRTWLSRGVKYPLRTKLVDLSIKDCYTRLIQPLLTRQMMAELTAKAEHAAVEVFATNLKKLLLMPPLRGEVVLGIDPGYRNGCKVGITSSTGSVLATDVIYPQFGVRKPPPADPAALKLKDLLTKFSCEVIALGNGTACRETELYLSDLIQAGWFKPLNVKYAIVSEQGASIYSCSPVAQKEFPDTNPNIISAVSLSRRLQDPLGELVKVEPKHLGVGMYQHDVPEKQLSSTLDEVVIECVSFVGVDINIASSTLLRRIAGLNSARADKIIEWRTSNGPFTNRMQLKKVKGIGVKTFEQCAGFIRIIPETAQNKSAEPSGKSLSKKMRLSDDAENPLDRTWIHPESYSVALRFIEKCELRLEDLGTPNFISKVGSTVARIGLKNMAEEFGVAEPVMKLISDGLQQAPDHDIRSEFQKPLFRSSVSTIEELTVGEVLTGRVQNVTHFGTFVDVGVGQDGLIPESFLRASEKPQLGDRIEVEVHNIDINRRRITLRLKNIL